MKLEEYKEPKAADYAKDVVAFAKNLYKFNDPVVQPYQLDWVDMMNNTLTITIIFEPIDYIVCNITVV